MQNSSSNSTTDGSSTAQSIIPQESTPPTSISSGAYAESQQTGSPQPAVSDPASDQTDAQPREMPSSGAGKLQEGQQPQDSTSSSDSSLMSRLRQAGSAKPSSRASTPSNTSAELPVQGGASPSEQGGEGTALHTPDEDEDSTSRMLQSSGI